MHNGLKPMFFMKEKIILVLKKKCQYFMKTSGKMTKIVTDTLAKMSQNIFAYFPFPNILHLFLYFRKKTILVTARGFTPPPPRLRTGR